MTSLWLLEVLVSLSLQVAVVILVTAWLVRFVPESRRQCQLWNLCYLLIPGLVATGTLLPHLRLFHPWEQLSDQSLVRFAGVESELGVLILTAWVTGACLSVVLLIREWWLLQELMSECQPVGDDWPTLPLLAVGKTTDRKDRPVRIVTHPEVGSPFCCQWHEPVIVLPAFMQWSSAKELEFVLRHELEHLRSGHPLQAFVERLVESLFWFHPLVWWASRLAALSREFACDDAPLSDPRDTRDYVLALVAIAERGLDDGRYSTRLNFGRKTSVLSLRSRRLIAQAEAGPYRRARWQQTFAIPLLLAVSLVAGLVWVPVNVLASSRTHWSPWPGWSASFLRTLEIPVRDYEPYARRTRLFELRSHTAPGDSSIKSE